MRHKNEIWITVLKKKKNSLNLFVKFYRKIEELWRYNIVISCFVTVVTSWSILQK